MRERHLDPTPGYHPLVGRFVTMAIDTRLRLDRDLEDPVTRGARRGSNSTASRSTGGWSKTTFLSQVGGGSWGRVEETLRGLVSGAESVVAVAEI